MVKTIIKFASLSQDKQKNIRLIYSYMDLLREFSNKATVKLFIHLYGEQLGLHLWDKYIKIYNQNIIEFLNYLDVENKSILYCNIFINESGKPLQDTNTLYAHC